VEERNGLSVQSRVSEGIEQLQVHKGVALPVDLAVEGGSERMREGRDMMDGRTDVGDKKGSTCTPCFSTRTQEH